MAVLRGSRRIHIVYSTTVSSQFLRFLFQLVLWKLRRLCLVFLLVAVQELVATEFCLQTRLFARKAHSSKHPVRQRLGPDNHMDRLCLDQTQSCQLQACKGMMGSRNVLNFV